MPIDEEIQKKQLEEAVRIMADRLQSHSCCAPIVRSAEPGTVVNASLPAGNSEKRLND